MNIPQAVLAMLAILGAYHYGYRKGYRKGTDDCEFAHDFDKCPHCGEYLDPEDDS
jgi:hypothetical protein